MLSLFFAQKAFITDGSHLLLVQKSSTDPNHPNSWEVPGGRLEPGEELGAHLEREVQEEVGLAIEVGDAFFVWQWTCNAPIDEKVTVPAQIIAVARICWPRSSSVVSTTGQHASDHLSDAKWTPHHIVRHYDVIPNMLPVLNKYLTLWNTDSVVATHEKTPPIEMAEVSGSRGVRSHVPSASS